MPHFGTLDIDLCGKIILNINFMRLTKLTLLEHIEQIVELSLKSGLKDDFFEKAKPHLKYVKRVLQLNDVQAVFMSHFMDQSDSSRIYPKLSIKDTLPSYP
jgi:hypothetical protein